MDFFHEFENNVLKPLYAISMREWTIIRVENVYV